MSDLALLRQAFIDATLEIAGECATGEAIDCSARHRKRLRSMGISVGLANRTKILIALIAAAVLLTGCAVFREQIAGLLLTFGNGFVNIEGSTSDAPREIEHAYAATYVPEGFVEVERVEEWYQVKTVWENANGDSIEIYQDVIYGSGFGADTKYSETSKIELEQFDVLNIEGKGYSIYYWSDNLYVFQLQALPSLDKDAALNIIKGLK
jgi:hypothetical protein